MPTSARHGSPPLRRGSRGGFVCALATLALILFPFVGLAAACGCDDSCPIHPGRAKAEAPAAHCHEDSASGNSSACRLVAPCRHSSGATPVLAHPPAVLTPALALFSPRVEHAAAESTVSSVLPRPRDVPDLPPRILPA